MHGTDGDWIFGHGVGMSLLWVLGALMLIGLIKFIFFR